MIARLKCWIFGHRRGRRISMLQGSSPVPINTFECPRCRATWTRKAKA